MIKHSYLALAISAQATLAMSEDPARWYIGGGLGEGEAEVIGHDRRAQVVDTLADDGYQPAAVTGSEQDDTDTWKLYAGYHIKPWLAAELSYYDLGHTSGLFSATFADSSLNDNGKIRSEYQAFALTAVAHWAIVERLSLFAKAGLHRWEHDFQLKGSSITSSETTSGTGPLYGFGAKVNLWRDLALKIEWERLADIEEEDGLDVKSLSLEFAF